MRAPAISVVLLSAVGLTACAENMTFKDATGQKRDLAALQMDGAACDMASKQAVPTPAVPYGCNAGCALVNTGAMIQNRDNYFVTCMQAHGWALQSQS